MAEIKEITVTIKDEERRVNHKFLVYDDFEMSSEDETIQQCIEEAQKSFQGEPESIKIKAVLELQ